MRSRLVHFSACCLVASLVSACGSLLELPGQGPGPQLYNLSALEGTGADQQMGTLRLLVEEPDAPRAIDSDRIALHPSQVEIKYYKDAKWSDRAPRLVQTLLVESFDNTGSFEFVGRDSAGLTMPYLLKSSLSDFHTTYEGRRPTAVVKLKLSIIDRGKGRILAARIFESRSNAQADSIKPVVLAFDAAVNQILKDAVPWTLGVLNIEQAESDDEADPVEPEERPDG